jgi:hypothetical protein
MIEQLLLTKRLFQEGEKYSLGLPENKIYSQ